LEHPSHPGRRSQPQLYRQTLGFFPRVSPVASAPDQGLEGEGESAGAKPAANAALEPDSRLAEADWDWNEKGHDFLAPRRRQSRGASVLAGLVEFIAGPSRLIADILGPKIVTAIGLLVVVGGILLAAAAPPSAKSPSPSPQAAAPTGASPGA